MSFCTAPGDASLRCTPEVASIVLCICRTKNPSGHIIPGNANFVLSEFFVLNKQVNYNTISNYVVKYTINDQKENT